MESHYIIMASAYSIGKRIALDYNDSGEEAQKALEYILNTCGNDVPISTHFIQTDSNKWESVVNKDSFFREVELLERKEDFASLVLKDRQLSGVDVAKYILTQIPCTHLKLEKLSYLCYADYLCNKNKKLFFDKIYAFKLGPVIDSIYKKYKKRGSDVLAIEDDKIVYDEKSKTMPIRSRILSAKDGVQKLVSIDNTLKKYGNLSAKELVDLTHKKDSPWIMSYDEKLIFCEITDVVIKQYHKNETL